MAGIIEVLSVGLPVLIGQLAATLALLGVGIACYMAITPFNEAKLVREGNVAAGIVIAGTLIALALTPLAATLASSIVVLDIVVWGLIALIIQLATFIATTLMIKGFRGMIEAGNIAAALVLIGIQIAVVLLNAGAMSG